MDDLHHYKTLIKSNADINDLNSSLTVSKGVCINNVLLRKSERIVKVGAILVICILVVRSILVSSVFYPELKSYEVISFFFHDEIAVTDSYIGARTDKYNFHKALELASEGYYTQAAELLEKEYAKYPDRYGYCFFIGKLYLQGGNYRKANPYLRVNIEQNTLYHDSSQFYLLGYYMAQGYNNEAIKLARKYHYNKYQI